MNVNKKKPDFTHSCVLLCKRFKIIKTGSSQRERWERGCLGVRVFAVTLKKIFARTSCFERHKTLQLVN